MPAVPILVLWHRWAPLSLAEGAGWGNCCSRLFCDGVTQQKLSSGLLHWLLIPRTFPHRHNSCFLLLFWPYRVRDFYLNCICSSPKTQPGAAWGSQEAPLPRHPVVSHKIPITASSSSLLPCPGWEILFINRNSVFSEGETEANRNAGSPRNIVDQLQTKYMHLARARCIYLLYMLCCGLSIGKPQSSRNLCIFQWQGCFSTETFHISAIFLWNGNSLCKQNLI